MSDVTTIDILGTTIEEFNQTQLRNYLTLTAFSSKSLLQRIRIAENKFIEIEKFISGKTSVLFYSAKKTQQISPENFPRNIREAKNPLALSEYLKHCYARVVTLTDGQKKLYLNMRLVGGGTDSDQLDKLNEDLENYQSLSPKEKKEVIKKVKEEVKIQRSIFQRKIMGANCDLSSLNLIVGATRAGKSTLFDFLNNYPMIVRPLKSGRLALDVDTSQLTKAQRETYAPIGHEYTSETTIPNFAKSPTSDATYVDCAGEFDSRNILQSIINAYFKVDLTESAKEVKLTLVIPESNLTPSGSGYFRQILSEIGKFIGDWEEFSKSGSISIVITQAPIGTTIDTYLQEISDILRQVSDLGKFKDILQGIYTRRAIGIFYVPDTSLTDQKKGQLSIIESMKAAGISDEQIQKVLQSSHMPLTNTEIESGKVDESKAYNPSNSPKDLSKEIESNSNFLIQEENKNFFSMGVPQNVQKVIEAIVSDLETSIHNEVQSSILHRIRKKISSRLSAGSLIDFEQYIRACTNAISIESLLKGLKIKGSRKLLTMITDLNNFRKLSNLEEDQKSYEFLSTAILKELRELQVHYNDISNKVISVKTNKNELLIYGFAPKISQALRDIDRSINSVIIIGGQRVVFDVDMPMGYMAGVNLSIIGNLWEIQGEKRVIDLSGRNSTDSFNETAKENETGAPGKPGQSAGHFFGFCNHAIDIEKLEIRANGGDGGDGQTGGHGLSGRKQIGNKAVEIIDNKKGEYETKVKNGYDIGYKYDYQRIEDLPQPVIEYRNRFKKAPKNLHKLVYAPAPDTPEPGQKGKDGGKGGIGGYPGKVTYIGLERPSVIEPCKGNGGRNGSGGLGGYGGTVGIWKIDYLYARGVVNDSDFVRVQEHQIKEITGPNAQPGNEGGNTANIEQPTPKADINIDSILSLTKQSLLDLDYPNQIFQDVSSHFIESLEENDEIKERISLYAFFEELNALEEECEKYQLRGIDVTPFYLSLQTRVSEYANKDSVDEEEIRALNFLYTKILSSIVRLKSNNSLNFVINIEDFLFNARENIKKHHNNGKAAIIEHYKEEYNNAIEGKIQEAQSFVKGLQKEINIIEKKISTDIEALLEEIDALEAAANQNKRDLRDKKRDLRRLMRLNMLLGGLKVLGAGLSFLGPQGTIIGGLISSGAGVAQSLTDSKTSAEFNLMRIPPAVEGGSSILKDEKFNEKITKLKDSIIEVKDEFFADDTEKEEETSTAASMEESTSAFSMSSTQAIEKTYNVGVAGMGIFQIYREDKKRIQQLNDAIDQTDRNIQKIVEFKGAVSDFLRVNIGQTLSDNLSELQDNLTSQSHIALDIKKWEIKKQLGQIKLQIEKITKGFTVEKEVTETIQKMIDALETEIQIFDRIQDLHDQSLLANYIAKIESSGTKDQVFSDQNLQKQVDRINRAIGINLVLDLYNKALEAVKQWAFPFAHIFVEDFNILPNFDESKTLEDVMLLASHNINNLISKVRTHFASIIDIDEVIHSNAEFYSKRTTDPFFVWHGNQNPLIFERLLKGEKVLLRSMPHLDSKSAVKFSEIGLRLVGTKTETTLKLNDSLQDYIITLKHKGESLYRYNNAIYKIGSDPLLLSYSYENSESGLAPADCNEAYRKLTEGDSRLSPYGLWEIQIKPAKKTKNHPLPRMIPLIRNLKLELVGKGYYVDEDAIRVSDQDTSRLDDLNLEAYYAKVSERVSDLRRPLRKSTTAIEPSQNNPYIQRDNKAYWYQSQDISHIYNSVLVERTRKRSKFFVQLIDENISTKSLISTLSHFIKYMCKRNRTILCIYDIGNLHWVSFAIVKDPKSGNTIILYKDPTGKKNDALEGIFKSIDSNIVVLSNEKSEQREDPNSGIHTTENLSILAEELKNDAPNFIEKFPEYDGFCNHELAKKHRKKTFPELYVLEVNNRLHHKGTSLTANQEISNHHLKEINTIKEILQDDGISVSYEKTNTIEEILSNNKYYYYYVIDFIDSIIAEANIKEFVEERLSTHLPLHQIDHFKVYLYPNDIPKDVLKKEKKINISKHKKIKNIGRIATLHELRATLGMGRGSVGEKDYSPSLDEKDGDEIFKIITRKNSESKGKKIRDDAHETKSITTSESTSDKTKKLSPAPIRRRRISSRKSSIL